MTDQELIQTVKESKNVSDVCRKLNIAPGGGNYKTIRNKIKRLNIDTSHFEFRRLGQTTLRNIPTAQLAEIVSKCSSYRQVCKMLGVREDGGTMTNLVKILKSNTSIDVSHFSGQGWLKGKTHNFLEHRRIKDEDLFIENYSGGVTTGNLKKRLFEEGREHRCERCSNTVWNNLPIPLELDHINGNSQDNRKENLAILCPNCHAQTPTYRGKNLSQYRPPQ